MKTEFQQQLDAEVANINDQLRQIGIELGALASEAPSSRARAVENGLRRTELCSRRDELLQSMIKWLDIIRTYVRMISSHLPLDCTSLARRSRSSTLRSLIAIVRARLDGNSLASACCSRSIRLTCPSMSATWASICCRNSVFIQSSRVHAVSPVNHSI